MINIVKAIDCDNVLSGKVQFAVIYITTRHCKGGGRIVIYIVCIDFVDGHGADRFTPGQNGPQLRGSGIAARQHEVIHVTRYGEAINFKGSRRYQRLISIDPIHGHGVVGFKNAHLYIFRLIWKNIVDMD